MSYDELLANLGLYVDNDAHALICFREGCQCALFVADSRVTTHLRDKHKVPEESRKEVAQLLKHLLSMSIRNPNEVPPLHDGAPEHELLRLYDGFACRSCDFRTVSLPLMKRHFTSSSMVERCPSNCDVHCGRDIDTLFSHVYLQTWNDVSLMQRYWIVERNGSFPRLSDGLHIRPHRASLRNRELGRRQVQKEKEVRQLRASPQTKPDPPLHIAESRDCTTSDTTGDNIGRRRILFIDAFDSFTNNIVGLLEQTLDAEVSLVHINNEEVSQDLNKVLGAYDAVVVGPGPGHPAIHSDVGFIKKLWELDEAHMLPVFGVCLGFQSLCHSYGAEVKKLPLPRHGIISPVTHNNQDIFSGVGCINATQYHSLRVDIGGVEKDGQIFWEPSKACSSLRPLAWDVDDEGNGPILMAARHTTKPFWGVQFHPESICTSKEGKEVISNWWTHAKEWLCQRNRKVKQYNGPLPPIASTRKSAPDPASDKSSSSSDYKSHFIRELQSIADEEDVRLRWGIYPTARITPTAILDALGHSREEVILLDSQGHTSGRFSILGLVVPGKTMKVTYKVSDRTMRYQLRPGEMFSTRLSSIDDIWPIFQEALDVHDPRSGDYSHAPAAPGAKYSAMDGFVEGHFPDNSPFWGGFMGYISYEAGLETIDIEPKVESEAPDINFAFIHRSIVIDHQTSHVYVQSLLPSDWEWILNVGRIIGGLASQAEILEGCQAPCVNNSEAEDSQSMDLQDAATLDTMLSNAQVIRPDKNVYKGKVLLCQESLASGDSYEICFTDETQIIVPAVNGMALDEWSLYKRLRQNNPAPFGAFIRLSGCAIVGSSPERFLRWSRDGQCQFRPIKGTVKKSKDMTRERAHAILNSSKERAENLMIVDLIRHDLSGVIGAENTRVSQLMIVEEYETVYQLVSVIEGDLPASGSNRHRGLQILKASLPPGSMTGAPKKRSCEILQDIEQRPRGAYSGVLGYMDVGGAGDFSVVIRTAIRGYNSASGTAKTNGNKQPAAAEGHTNGYTQRSDMWYVGAGGAVTIQSTDEGEFLEMETKASSVLGALMPHMKH